jgi:hypothetical protein
MTEHPASQPPSGRAEPLPSELLLAFAPLHKAAFGAAIGAACALLLLGLTALTVLRGTQEQFNIELLSVFFRGYSLSFSGALIGAVWAGFMGFVFGWFFAFCRNLVVAVSLFVIRTRAELARTRDFLDHV